MPSIDEGWFAQFDTGEAGGLGRVTLTSRDGRALGGLFFDGQKYFPTIGSRVVRNDGLALFVAARQQFEAYLRGELEDFDLPLDLAGTSFQRRVWDGLLAVRCGQTISYGDLSRRIGCAQAVRAVGAAVGRNPVSVVVPCHRILGASGDLTGYAGGLDRKRRLLAIERALPMAGLFDRIGA